MTDRKREKQPILNKIIFLQSVKGKLDKIKMDNYALVIDVSSDEENNRYSTPIKTLPVNMVGRLSLSDFSVEVWRGSEASLNSSRTSASTFNCEPEEAFVVENQNEDESDDYYEAPESPRVMPK